MKLKRSHLISILLTLLVVINISFSFAYWASNIYGTTGQGQGGIDIGDWPFIPEDADAGIGNDPDGDVITLDMIGSPEYPEYPIDGYYVLVDDIIIDDTIICTHDKTSSLATGI